MNLPLLLSIALSVCLTVAFCGAIFRFTRWRQGRQQSVPWIAGLLRLPKRYLVDLHAVVAKEPASARFHVLGAGGLVASIILLVLAHLPGHLWRSVLPWLVALALLSLLCGAVLALWRRARGSASQEDRLSGGAWQRLPWSLGAFALGCLIFTCLLLVEGAIPRDGFLPSLAALLILWGFAEIFIGLTWGGPMTHAFAGALHLAWHPRPARFSAGPPDSALESLDLEAPRLGAASVQDLTWNRILGLDACVQCGRCQAACPAFDAGQPLNPKKLVQDLASQAMDFSHKRSYHGQPHPGHGSVPAPLESETLWSCTTCRACVAACPMMIEQVDAIIDFRRFQTLEVGATPDKGAQALEQLRLADNPGGLPLSQRLDWAVDLQIPVIDPQRPREVLLWLGDAAFNLRNQRTLRALVQLLRQADVDFAVLGAEERDVGDLARRLGDEATFQRLAQENINCLARYQFDSIVTSDPHVFHSLAREYPDFVGNYTVWHHSQFLLELTRQGRLTFNGPDKTEEPITYHDPCYLARYNGETTAPRALLEAAGIVINEMERSGPTARCCGGGGGAPLADVPGRQRIPDMRMQDAKKTGCATLAVACPNCMVMLEGVVENPLEVRDIAEILADRLAQDHLAGERQS